MNRLSSRLEGPAMFEDEVKEATPAGAEATQQPGRKKGALTRTGASLVKEHLERAVDPDPRSRVRWERKMVIRQVQRGTNPFSRESRAARIARTERQLTTKSPFLATSVKKLVHLARQIQGKTVAEALVQMRYSKKKMAQEVGYQLELARDLAVVERGMGLGEAKRAAAVANGEEVEAAQPVKIQTKDGKWVTIEDPTRMYVAEAWVNRGPWRGSEPDYRARGRMYLKMKPSTSKLRLVCLLAPFLTHPQVSRSSSRRTRQGYASTRSARPRRPARGPGSTSPTARLPLSGSTTPGRRFVYPYGTLGVGGVVCTKCIIGRQRRASLARGHAITKNSWLVSVTTVRRGAEKTCAFNAFILLPQMARNMYK